MTNTESERRLAEYEARYLARLRAKMGDNLKADVLEVMVGLYRAGWRDCRMAGMMEEV